MSPAPIRCCLAPLLPLLILAACQPHSVVSPTSGPPGVVRSNLLRGDYAGSAACQNCHVEVYREWQAAPMRRMTRLIGDADVKAPFSGGGALFRFKGDRAEMLEKGGERFIRVESPRFGNRTYRVTKVIGGHHREDFAGVEVAAAEPGAAAVGEPIDRVLPVSWLIESRSWRYKGYSVMVNERPGMGLGGSWSSACILCHNTAPYLTSILGALAGPRTPPYQGEVVDALLPAERRWSFAITDDARLRQALLDELGHLGQVSAADEQRATPLLLQRAVTVTRNRFRQPNLVEVGIGCESCHGGSREHVEAPRLRPTFEVKSDFLLQKTAGSDDKPIAAAELRAQRINRTCARCHQVLFSRYPWTWEGGKRPRVITPEMASPGGSNVNSGEARDLLLGACASRLACVACHDPHAHDDRAALARLETPAGDEVCLVCHGTLRGAAAARAHSHHDPAGAGGRCIGCHMARKNMSLDSRLTRYHRIGSPDDPTRVEQDRPLECALCHADRNVATLVDTMERWWPNRRHDRAALTRLYGALDADPLLATLTLGKPHEQVAAIATLGAARRRDAAAAIALHVVHPIPLVRIYALQALEAIVGAKSGIDLHQENGEIEKAVSLWLDGAGLRPGAPPRAPRPATDDPAEQ